MPFLYYICRIPKDVEHQYTEKHRLVIDFDFMIGLIIYSKFGQLFEVFSTHRNKIKKTIKQNKRVHYL